MLQILNDNFGKSVRDVDATAASEAMLDPNSVNPLPLDDGEWVVLDTANTCARAADNPASAYPVWTERGRTDVQAIGKVSYLEDFEGLRIETDMFNQAAPGGYTLNGRLTVESIDIDGVGGVEQSVLVPAVAGEPVFAICTKVPTAATDTLGALLGRNGVAP